MANLVIGGHAPLRRPSRMGKSCGGDSVPELAECFASAGGEVTARLGDVFHADETHDAHGEATQSRHHAVSVLGANLGEIFVVGGIADMMVGLVENQGIDLTHPLPPSCKTGGDHGILLIRRANNLCVD